MVRCHLSDEVSLTLPSKPKHESHRRIGEAVGGTRPGEDVAELYKLLSRHHVSDIC